MTTQNPSHDPHAKFDIVGNTRNAQAFARTAVLSKIMWLTPERSTGRTQSKLRLYALARYFTVVFSNFGDWVSRGSVSITRVWYPLDCALRTQSTLGFQKANPTHMITFGPEPSFPM